MSIYKDYNPAKIEKLKLDAQKELKTVLKKLYPFIPVEDVQDAIMRYAESYSLDLEADLNKLSQQHRDAHKEWIALGKLNTKKVSYISFGIQGAEQNLKLDSKTVMDQLFRSLEELIKSYSNGVNLFSSTRAVEVVKRFSKDLMDYLNKNFPDKFKKKVDKYRCIASLANCFTQLHPQGREYEEKGIQDFLKKKSAPLK